jgi:cellobiose epimerase
MAHTYLLHCKKTYFITVYQHMNSPLHTYKKELENELAAILEFWMQHCLDNAQGGFIGRIDHDNNQYADAPKGAVLNSRILWTFSAAARYKGQKAYAAVADRAFKYMADFFIDKQHGGVYWSVTAGGQPLDTKKQIYALSFAVYGLSEYYRLCTCEEAKTLAVELFYAIERYSHDPVHGGYLEALTRDWQPIADLRLSAKDRNEKKSMNTHLHVLEGYANLYRIWPDAELKEKIVALIRIFLDHIIHPQSGHLNLFFDERWQPRSTGVSYGHDIEAAWLVQEAAEVIENKVLIEEVKQASLLLAHAAARGLDKDGGLWYEVEEGHLVKEKHWWPQAETMVGFFNAWQVSGDEKELQRSIANWNFVKAHILDRERGEWVWGVRADYSLMREEDKVGTWKCPYHNGRACLELLHRMNSIET